MSKKLPAIQWYPGDWRKDPGIQALDYESRGVWFEMLMMMHESEERGKLVLNGKAMPDEALANILGLNVAKLQQIVSKLLSYGVANKEQDSGVLYNRRMSNDEALRAVRAEAGAKGGKQTASKRAAGRQQKSTPSSSSSISTTNIKHNDQDLSVAKTIFRLIQNMNPNHRQPNFDKWADTIRLMRERDSRTHEEILAVFTWANNDSFWKTNILSPDTLRKQWDKLVIKIRSSQNEKSQRDNGRLSASESAAAASERLEKRIREEDATTIHGQVEPTNG